MAKRNLRIVLGFVAVCLFASAHAQEAKLVEAARAEGGKIVVYGSIENETMELVSNALKKKTGLQVEYWRASATKVLDRVLNETRTGKPLYDVVSGGKVLCKKRHASNPWPAVP